MLGLMQDWPLLMHRIIDHAATFHGERKVITPLDRRADRRAPITREIRARALKVAQRLEKDGIKLGDRVATLAWNTWRHLESLVRHHSASARSITPSIRGCSPSRSSGSSITPKTA